MPEWNFLDCVIIGGVAAGLTAGICRRVIAAHFALVDAGVLAFAYGVSTCIAGYVLRAALPSIAGAS
jgi:hypothetical protein